MNTEEWIDAWLSRHPSHDTDDSWQDVEAWANESEAVARWTEVGSAYRRLKLFGRARTAYKAAIKCAQDEYRGLAYSNYASFLLELREFDEALAVFELAWEIQALPSVGLGFSSALLEAREDQRALAFLLSESECLKELPGYWSNLSIAYTRSGAYVDARDAAFKAHAMNDSQENQFQLSLTVLRMPNEAMSLGWEYFETRPNRPSYDKTFGAELKSIISIESGDRVVVFCEQGIGDILQFIRFASDLEAAGARVVIAGAPRMEPLITSSFPSFSYVRSPGEAMKLRPKFWVPLLSLPRVLELEQPVSNLKAYLVPPTSAFQLDEPAARIRIGLAWKGNPAYPNDHLRSAALSEFEVLLDDDRLEVCSLLMNMRDEVSAAKLTHLPEGIDSEGIFSDTASVVSKLDAVVSTDTSIAHLSAGLGIPTYLLLNKGADWRWGTPQHPSNWYQSMELIWLDESGFSGGAERVLKRLFND